MDSDCSVRRRDADGARAWGLRLTLAVSAPLALTLALTIPGAAAAQTLPPSRAASASDGAASPGAAQLGRRVALVIGNSKYSRVSDLGGKPINDAHDVSLALRGFGFEVLELLDGDKAQMEDKLTEFSQKIDGASAAFVFYAGHAAQLRGENYLMPVNVNVNTEAAIRADSISLSRVLDELEGAKDRINIVMLDACRNNPVTGKFRDARNGLAAPSVAPKGTVIVYATDPGNTAENGNGRNGVFTAGLLKAFAGKDLSLDAVLTVASEEVERTTERRQTPYVNGPKTVQKQFQFRVTVEPGPQQLESEIWATAQKQNTPAAYEVYKKRYPKGAYVEFADLAITALKPVVTSTPVDVVAPPPTPAHVVPVPATAAASPPVAPLAAAPRTAGYSKISNRGELLSDSATLGEKPDDWACTKDNVTGLIWEVKTASGLRDQKHRYTWFDPGVIDGNPGEKDGGRCYRSGRCDTEKFVQDVNGAGLCGSRSWRMPSRDELKGIVRSEYAKQDEATIDPVFFPNTPRSNAWSSSPAAYSSSNAWYVSFNNGSAYSNHRGNPGQVRVVRSGQ